LTNDRWSLRCDPPAVGDRIEAILPNMQALFCSAACLPIFKAINIYLSSAP
jgi:hypothetical protein